MEIKGVASNRTGFPGRARGIAGPVHQGGLGWVEIVQGEIEEGIDHVQFRLEGRLETDVGHGKPQLTYWRPRPLDLGLLLAGWWEASNSVLVRERLTGTFSDVQFFTANHPLVPTQSQPAFSTSKKNKKTKASDIVLLHSSKFLITYF